MLAKKPAAPGNPSPKETAMQEVTLHLMTNLSSLKESLGEKKFEKRVRKAAKLLTSGISKELAVEKPAAKKSPVKKAAKKAPQKRVVKKSATAGPVKKTAVKAGVKK